MNQLILGDCLDVLNRLEAESVDLIYLDPPFFSNRTYELIWGDAGEIRSFQDRWAGGIDHYIAWLKERVQVMHRLLKPTGAIFLHCDWHAEAHIKVFILDKIFGEQNFKNKLTWKRADSHNDAKKQFPNVSDDIYFYSKSEKFVFHVQYGGHADKTLKDWYQYLEFPDGTTRKMTKEEKETQRVPKNARRFNTADMSNPSRVWQAGQYEYKGYSYPPNGWRFSLETMQKLDEENKLFFPKAKTGRIMLKRYLDEQNGSVIGDVWDDITQIRGTHKERIGYPTQKPEALLERIITCASNEGDTVLDPFVGGGTTIAVADRLNRRWIGIDQSVAAVKVTEFRLNRQRDLFSKPFVVQLHKYDYDTLRYQDAFAFESWIIQQFGGFANAKQKGDLGIDGRTRDGLPMQVKRSDNIGRNVIDNFKAACERFDKTLFAQRKAAGQPVGVLIAFSFGKGAVQEVARLKNEENLTITLVTVDAIVPIAKKPTLTVEFRDLGLDAKQQREIEFTAVGASEAGIELYAWDFAYDAEQSQFKPQVLRDKEGKQTQKFPAGTHRIAVKVVDLDGLESLEVVTLKINGVARQNG